MSALAVEPGEALAAFADFCAALRLEDGRPMRLEPFQRRMLEGHFDGVTEVLILLPKKNGKSTLLAALALFHLIATKDAECVVAAASRDQATILLDQAVGFVRRSAGLQERVVIKRGYRELRSKRDTGRIRVLASDVDTADGVIPTLALVDELHRHRSAELYGVFRDGLGPRDGQMMTISTAGEHEGSPLGVMRQAARQLDELDRSDRYLHARSEDGSFEMHEWALDAGDDVDDIELVKRVNPASWHTIKRLQRRHDSPTTRPAQWARFACGIWMAAEDWWIAGEDWQEIRAREAKLLRGDRITLGFDGSRYRDATALVACRLDDGLLVPLGMWEMPEGAREWEVPAGEIDQLLALAFETFRVERLYCDPPLWQSEIDEWARLYGEVVLRFPTARTRMTQAVERFRTDVVAGGSIRQNGDEALSRHVLNAQMRQTRAGYWLEKPRAGTAGNIDGAVAAVLAYEARCDALASADERQGHAFL